MLSLVQGRQNLIVRQIKEWGEILVGFECRNRFELQDEQGVKVGYAAEQGEGFGAVIARNFLGYLRNATFHILDADGREVGRVTKPFRWFFHRAEVFVGGQRIGAIERRWSLLNRHYVLENAAGEAVLDIVSPFFKIWTFELRDHDQKIGVIRKQWGGVLREVFTDADSFGVEFPPDAMGDKVRMLLVGATFLIDMIHFENNNRNSG